MLLFQHSAEVIELFVKGVGRDLAIHVNLLVYNNIVGFSAAIRSNTERARNQYGYRRMFNNHLAKN